MFAFVTHETRLRPWSRAYSNANRMIRSEPGAADRLHGDAGAGGDLLRLQAVQLRDHALRLGCACFVLDPGVEVLGVLADDHQVDVVVARAHALEGLARTKAGVEAELVAERDVDRAETRADRGRDRPLQRDLVRLHRRERLVRQRRALLLHDVDAGVADVPVERDSRRLEHAARRLGQLRAGPVAGDEGDTVRHCAGQRTHRLADRRSIHLVYRSGR